MCGCPSLRQRKEKFTSGVNLDDGDLIWMRMMCLMVRENKGQSCV